MTDTVAITGGGGFIGKAVDMELTRRGHTAVPMDLPHFDIRLLAELGEVDAVIHLAGMLGTHELFDQVHTAIHTNVDGTVNVLEAALKARARYVGITMPAVFPSIYTATKMAAVGMERAYHHTYRLPVSRVRAFNAFGPGQKHGLGHPQKIIPTFATLAWQGRPIPIWGDGEQTVDLIDVNTLARLLVDALDHGDDATFDGGTGIAMTVNEVADLVIKMTGSKAGVEYLPMRRGEVPTHIVATGEGWERLDWKPILSLDVLEETVWSYRERR